MIPPHVFALVKLAAEAYPEETTQYLVTTSTGFESKITIKIYPRTKPIKAGTLELKRFLTKCPTLGWTLSYAGGSNKFFLFRAWKGLHQGIDFHLLLFLEPVPILSFWERLYAA